MSTSDPEHPSSSPTPAEPTGTQEPTSASEPTGTQGQDVGAVHGTQPTPPLEGAAPAPEPPPPPAAPATRQAPAVTWPSGSATPSRPDGPPPSSPTPPPEPSQSQPHPPQPTPSQPSPPQPSAPGAQSPDPFPASEPEREPRRGAGVGGHLLAILIGAVLSVFAMVLLLLGEARILGSEDPTAADGIGIVLVTLGVLLLATVVYLGVWSAALPITGGVILTAVGGFYLYFPSVARDETLRLLATDASRTTVIYGIVASTMGVVFVVGVLLLVAGWALAVARRRGRALGAFRERVRRA